MMRMTGSAQDAMWRAVQSDDYEGYRQALGTLRLVPSPRQGLPPQIPVRLFTRPAAPAGGVLSLWAEGSATSRPVAATLPHGSWTTLADCLLALAQQHCEAAARPAAAAAAGCATAPLEQLASQAALAEARQDSTAIECSVSEPLGASLLRASISESAASRTDSGDPSDATPATASSVAGAGPSQPPEEGPWLQAALVAQRASFSRLRGECWVAGLQPPADTPLAWLHANFHAADGFLYIVVIHE